MELNKKAAYLQGLVDGLGVDESTKEGKIIKAMAALLGEMADAIAAMDEDLTHAYDQINDLSEELEDLEADLYVDEDAEDEDDDAADEDEDAGDDDIASEPFYEVACPACGETVYVSEDDLDAGEANCAHCGVTFEVALEGDGEDDADGEQHIGERYRQIHRCHGVFAYALGDHQPVHDGVQAENHEGCHRSGYKMQEL